MKKNDIEKTENIEKDTVVFEQAETEQPGTKTAESGSVKNAGSVSTASDGPEAAPAEPVKAAPKKNRFRELFGDKPVTRKFLAAALGITLLLNAGISAGLMAIFAGNIKSNIPSFDRSGRPGQEQNFGDQDSNGRMAPPSNGNGGGSQQNGSDSQQSENKVSIGIVIRDNDGVYVAQVTGNNAKKAGFQEGDKIVSFDGTSVSTSNDLVTAVQQHKAGDTVSVTVERDGQQVEITTTLE